MYACRGREMFMRTQFLNGVGCLAAVASIILPEQSPAQTCPPLPNQVSTRVIVSLRFDATGSLYTYGYAVKNDASSAQDVKSFAIDFTPPVSNIARPDGWLGKKPMRDRSTVYWSAHRVANPGRVTNDARVPPSIVQIKPGASLGGFSFQSPKPPGLVRYYAIGYIPPEAQPGATGVDEAEAELRAEELLEQCPQLGRPILEQAATGTSIGPVDAIPVPVEVKPGSSPAPVNPTSQGVLPVAILGSGSLDVRTIDTSTVRLGISQTAPRNGAHIEDVNGDGIPDLMFQFPTQDAGVQCGDTVVIISGKTVSGAAIAGFDTIRTVGCP